MAASPPLLSACIPRDWPTFISISRRRRCRGSDRNSAVGAATRPHTVLCCAVRSGTRDISFRRAIISSRARPLWCDGTAASRMANQRAGREGKGKGGGLCMWVSEATRCEAMWVGVRSEKALDWGLINLAVMFIATELLLNCCTVTLKVSASRRATLSRPNFHCGSFQAFPQSTPLGHS